MSVAIIGHPTYYRWNKSFVLQTFVLVEPPQDRQRLLSRILYAGTFGVVSTFYFATSSMLVRIAIALYLGRLSIGPEKYRKMM